jgi:TolB protein
LPASEIVVSADRQGVLSGEIYRVDLDGHRVNLSRSPFQDTQPLVSLDGKQVAFVSDRTGRPAVYVVGVDGRGLERVSAGLAQPTLLGWSSGGKLAVETRPSSSSGAMLHILRPGRREQWIVHQPQGSWRAAWSPDGRLIAVGGGGIGVVTASGASVFRVQCAACDFAWSAKGRLAVVSPHLIRVFDHGGRLLARFPGDGLAWSPSGDRLATMAGGWLEVRGQGGSGGLVLRKRLFASAKIREVIMNMGGYEPALLWVGSDRVAIGNVDPAMEIVGAMGAHPEMTINTGVDLATGRLWRPSRQAWFAGSCECASPDSSLLAYTRRAGAGFALRVSKPDGSAVRTVARVPGCSSDGGFIAAVGGLQFADAGRSLVYQSTCDEPSANLYTVAPEGGRLKRLTTTRAQQTDPAWSADGTRIAFVQADATGASCKGCPSTLWVMDADGSNAKELTFALLDTSWDTSPSWSPDGKSIVYSRSTMDSGPVLFIVPATGGNPHHLQVAGTSPAWGPSRIAYLGSPMNSLWTIAPDGSDPHKLATGQRNDIRSPAWSRNGKLAYLEQNETGDKPVLVEINGTARRRVRLPFAQALDITWSPDGSRLAITARKLPTGPFDLFSITADGHNVERLSNNLDTLGADWGR